MEPSTIWTGQGGMYTSSTVANIADSAGSLLADPSSNLIVDTGIIFTFDPATIWVTDDSQ